MGLAGVLAGCFLLMEWSYIYLAILLPLLTPDSVLKVFVEAAHIGPLSMNELRISRKAAFTRNEIDWDEVEFIAMPSKGGRFLMLYGSRKLLTIPVPDLWTGRDKAAMVELFNRQVESRGLRVEELDEKIESGSWNTHAGRKPQISPQQR